MPLFTLQTTCSKSAPLYVPVYQLQHFSTQVIWMLPFQHEEKQPEPETIPYGQIQLVIYGVTAMITCISIAACTLGSSESKLVFQC